MRNLAARIAAEPAAPVIDPAIELLFDNLLLLEGLHPNPAGMAPRIQMMLERAHALKIKPQRRQDLPMKSS